MIARLTQVPTCTLASSLPRNHANTIKIKKEFSIHAFWKVTIIAVDRAELRSMALTPSWRSWTI